MTVHSVGHFGEIGRFFDNAGDHGTIIRPRSVHWSSRAIVFLPRWAYAVSLISCLVVGFGFGRLF